MSFSNRGVPPKISPEFIRRLHESVQKQLDEIHNIGKTLDDTNLVTDNSKVVETTTKKRDTGVAGQDLTSNGSNSVTKVTDSTTKKTDTVPDQTTTHSSTKNIDDVTEKTTPDGLSMQTKTTTDTPGSTETINLVPSTQSITIQSGSTETINNGLSTQNRTTTVPTTETDQNSGNTTSVETVPEEVTTKTLTTTTSPRTVVPTQSPTTKILTTTKSPGTVVPTQSPRTVVTTPSVNKSNNSNNTSVTSSSGTVHTAIIKPKTGHTTIIATIEITKGSGLSPTDDTRTGHEHIGNTNTGSEVKHEHTHSDEINDIDRIFFDSSKLNAKQKKQQRKQICSKFDFGDAPKGFQCCKKTLNCFDDLPENLDENLFHNGNTRYSEAERIHLCHHIDEALVCHGDVLTKPACKKVHHTLEDKITPQLNKVKLFYYNNCNRGTQPTSGVNPTFPPLPPNSSTTDNENVKGTGSKGTEHFHTDSSSYAPFIGGAVMGVFALIVILLFIIYCRKRVQKRKRNKERRSDASLEIQQSSRYKTVSYSRRKSDIYAEIDEKNMVSSVSLSIDGHCCSSNGSCGSRKLPNAPDGKRLEMDNHGYLSPRPSLPEDELKPDISDTNLFTHGYIELKSESGESAQSYAKLEPEPEDDYIQPDKIESSPSKKKPEEQGHMYFVLEKDNQESAKTQTM